MAQVEKSVKGRYEFTIDGEKLYSPRELLTAERLIEIAYKDGMLDQVDGGYFLDDGEGNTFAPHTLIDLYRNNDFYATEISPAPAS